MRMTMHLPNFHFSIPIESELAEDIATIPARSEVFRIFHFSETKFPRFIQTQEIEEGVFIPNTMIFSKDVWTRVLNTSSDVKYVSTELTSSEHIDEYDIYLPKCKSFTRKRDLSEKLVHMIPE